MNSIALIGLIKIELPSPDPTILLCDGGAISWNGDDYVSTDPLFGNIQSVEGLDEGTGDEVPALDVEFAPPGTAAVADLSKPGYQTSRARFWIAEYDVALGTVTGTPDLMFDGQIDQTSLRVGKDERVLATTIVSKAERLFERNIGNSLSPVFHKSVWAGELGHDNATGLKVPVAWGVEGPGRSFGSGGGGGAGGGSGEGNVFRESAL